MFTFNFDSTERVSRVSKQIWYICDLLIRRVVGLKKFPLHKTTTIFQQKEEEEEEETSTDDGEALEMTTHYWDYNMRRH